MGAHARAPCMRFSFAPWAMLAAVAVQVISGESGAGKSEAVKVGRCARPCRSSPEYPACVLKSTPV